MLGRPVGDGHVPGGLHPAGDPALLLHVFPNSDGPAHAATGAVLNTYSRPEGEEYRRYLMFREFPPPNVFGHLILAGLLRIVSLPVADKILAAVLMVAFPWSVRRALGAWSPQFRLFSYIALPFGSG